MQKFNPDVHKRESIRLKNYDYSSKGLYFITISLKDKLCFFGEIKNNEMTLFKSGKMIEEYWFELENKFKNIKLHNFVVMPNHFHWIIEIVKKYEQQSGWTHRFTPTGWEFEYSEKSISTMVQWFKTMTTNAYIKMVIKRQNRLIKNYGNKTFTNILLEVKNHIQKFMNILRIMFQNGKKIIFIIQSCNIVGADLCVCPNFRELPVLNCEQYILILDIKKGWTHRFTPTMRRFN